MKAKNILAIIATVFSLTVSATNLPNTETLTSANTVTTSSVSTIASASNTISQGVVLPVVEHRTYYTTESDMSVKWECDYDTMGRLVCKSGYVRLTANGDWQPRIAYSLFYNSDETVVTTARWDATHHTFRSGVVQKRYAAGTCPRTQK